MRRETGKDFGVHSFGIRAEGFRLGFTGISLKKGMQQIIARSRP